MSCHGVNQDGQPCPQPASAVMTNGYCQEHQPQALAAIQQVLNQLKALLQSGSDVQSTSSDVQLFLRDVISLQHGLAQRQTLCTTEGGECRRAVRDLIVAGTHALPQLQPNQRSSVESLLRDVERLSLASQGPLTDALRLTTDTQVNAVQHAQATQQIASLQARLLQLTEETSEHRLQHETARRQLQARENDMATHRSALEHQIAELQRALVGCKTAKVQGLEQLALQLRQTQSDLEAKSEVVKEALAERDRTMKNIQAIQARVDQGELAVLQLKTEYESKLSQMRDEFAQQVADGELVESSREVQLQRRLEELETKLEEAQRLNDKLFASARADGLEDVARSEEQQATPEGAMAGPVNLARVGQYSELVEQLELVRARLKQATAHRQELEQANDKLQTRQLELMDQLRRGSNTSTEELDKVTADLGSLQTQIGLCTNDRLQLQKEYRSFKVHTHNVQETLREELKQTRMKLEHMKAQRAQHTQYIQEQQQHLEKRESLMKRQRLYEAQVMRTRLQQEYKARERAERHGLEQMRLDVHNQARRMKEQMLILQHSQQAHHETQRQFETQRQEYEERLTSWTVEREQLRTELASAQRELKAINARERDYESRLSKVNHSAALAREQFHRSAEALRQHLQRAQQAKVQIEQSLGQCNVRRGKLVHQINQLAQENSDLRQKLQHLAAEKERTKVLYEQQISKMRADVLNMEDQVQAYHARLKDASAVHEHAEKMRNQIAKMMQALRGRAKALKHAQEAAEELLKNRDLQASRIEELQQAAEDCRLHRERVEGHLKTLTGELRTARDLQRERGLEARRAADELEQVLETRRAELQRVKFSSEAQRRQHEAELTRLQMELKQQRARLEETARSKQALAREFLDSESARSQQIRHLLTAQKHAGI